jgi:hypothetical protein
MRPWLRVHGYTRTVVCAEEEEEEEEEEEGDDVVEEAAPTRRQAEAAQQGGAQSHWVDPHALGHWVHSESPAPPRDVEEPLQWSATPDRTPTTQLRRARSSGSAWVPGVAASPTQPQQHHVALLPARARIYSDSDDDDAPRRGGAAATLSGATRRV